MKFEEKLMTLRKSKGWSQEDLSNQIGVSRQTISKWESSQTTPEMNKLIELSKIFEISVDELINDEKEEQEEEKEQTTYPKINLKATNILLIIACILTIVGLIFSVILYFRNKEDVYVEDIIMITYNYTMNDIVETVEIYSFNSNGECIGTNCYLKVNNDSDYKEIVKDINNSQDDVDNANLKQNIVFNNNEVTWSEKTYNHNSKDKVINKRKESLTNVQNLKITDM